MGCSMNTFVQYCQHRLQVQLSWPAWKSREGHPVKRTVPQHYLISDHFRFLVVDTPPHPQFVHPLHQKEYRIVGGSHCSNQDVLYLISKARFELAPSEEERHLKPPPWTARPSRQIGTSRRYTGYRRCNNDLIQLWRTQGWK